MGNTGIPVADSFRYLAKQYNIVKFRNKIKLKKKKEVNGQISLFSPEYLGKLKKTMTTISPNNKITIRFCYTIIMLEIFELSTKPLRHQPKIHSSTFLQMTPSLSVSTLANLGRKRVAHWSLHEKQVL